jgi:hypothetical protein
MTKPSNINLPGGNLPKPMKIPMKKINMTGSPYGSVNCSQTNQEEIVCLGQQLMGERQKRGVAEVRTRGAQKNVDKQRESLG